jgi:hypothetical protein
LPRRAFGTCPPSPLPAYRGTGSSPRSAPVGFGQIDEPLLNVGLSERRCPTQPCRWPAEALSMRALGQNARFEQYSGRPASQSGLPKPTCEHRSKRRGTAATPLLICKATGLASWIGWLPHTSREWIELIIMTVLLWLMMMAVFELELGSSVS